MTPKQLEHVVFSVACPECQAEPQAPCLLGKREGAHPKRVAQAVRSGVLPLAQSMNLPFLLIVDREQDTETERRKFVRHLVSDENPMIVAAARNSEGRMPTKKDVESGNY